MGKTKKRKKGSPWKPSTPVSQAKSSPPSSSSRGILGSPMSPVSHSVSEMANSLSKSQANAQLTVSKTDLAIVSPVSSDQVSPPNLKSGDVEKSAGQEIASDPLIKGVELANPVSPPSDSGKLKQDPKDANPDTLKNASTTGEDSWVNLVKGTSKPLKKKGTSFTLPSGEVCVKIPNSVIEKNQKSWECFVLGQFYSDPPSQGTLHNIVNGIWSKHYRDVAVSKLDGNAFLFRIPNASTRNYVVNQRLWQIEGQTMFVAKWEPGIVPKKPELTSAPIWLELRNVPLQFFNEEGLEHVAGLVGEPKYLHPATINKSNLEVAKVFTIIDPRKPLPEAVNVQFESGEIVRILVSSPWMPPVCSHCKEVGHTLKRCPKAPVTCKACNSTSHVPETCPKMKFGESKRRQQKKSSSFGHANALKEAKMVYVKVVNQPATAAPLSKTVVQGESSGLSVHSKAADTHVGEAKDSEHTTEVESDSSDILSSDPEDNNSGEEAFEKFQVVLSKRQRKVQRGKSLKST